VHRYDKGTFYPGGPDAAPEAAGVGAGLGHTVNIAWPRAGAGDAEYLLAMDQVPLALARVPDPSSSPLLPLYFPFIPSPCPSPSDCAALPTLPQPRPPPPPPPLRRRAPPRPPPPPVLTGHVSSFPPY